MTKLGSVVVGRGPREGVGRVTGEGTSLVRRSTSTSLERFYVLKGCSVETDFGHNRHNRDSTTTGVENPGRSESSGERTGGRREVGPGRG